MEGTFSEKDPDDPVDMDDGVDVGGPVLRGVRPGAAPGGVAGPRSATVAVIDRDTVMVPASVVAGEPFSVVIRTFNSSTCPPTTAAAVAMGPRAAYVVLVDTIRVPPDSPRFCSDDAEPFDHPVTVRFDQPGLSNVYVRGLYADDGKPLLVIRTVDVR